MLSRSGIRVVPEVWFASSMGNICFARERTFSFFTQIFMGDVARLGCDAYAKLRPLCHNCTLEKAGIWQVE
jgi:hypothetical protein